MPQAYETIDEPDDSLRSELAAAMEGDDGHLESAGGLHDNTGRESGDGERRPDADQNRSNRDTDRQKEAPGAKENRDEKGRYKGKEASGTPQDQAVTSDTNSPSKDEPNKASEQTASTPSDAPPVGWTAAEKAEWANLSPALKNAVSRREAEISNGGRQWSEEKRRYEAAIAPVAQLARSKGLDVSEGIQRLAAAQAFLDRDPIGGLRQIAQSYGVDLATLAGSSPADGASATQTPDISALIRQAVEPYVAPLQQRMQAEDERQQQMTTQLVTDFASAQGHEHFDAVQMDIMDMIGPLKARNPSWSPQQVLQEAYDRAVYANPHVRQMVMEQQRASADESRRKEAADRADKARKAAVSVTGTPSGTGAEDYGDLRSTITAAMNSA